MPHVLVLALYADGSAAAQAARALRAIGVSRERVSIVAQTHDAEGAVAEASDASPGTEIEDSARAARLGELGAHLLAAVALVLPGIGPIVADGPLAAELGEAAGHLAGGLPRALQAAGLGETEAEAWEARVSAGAVLVGAHVGPARREAVAKILRDAGAERVETGEWPD